MAIDLEYNVHVPIKHPHYIQHMCIIINNIRP